MANLETLRPHPPFTSDEARQAQKKSVIKRAENKTVRETVKNILAMPVTDKKQLAVIEKAGLPVPEVPTYLDYMCASIIQRTIERGRVDDLLHLMSILGENLDDTNEVTLSKAQEILGAVDSVIDQ